MNYELHAYGLTRAPYFMTWFIVNELVRLTPPGHGYTLTARKKDKDTIVVEVVFVEGALPAPDQINYHQHQLWLALWGCDASIPAWSQRIAKTYRVGTPIKH